MNSADDLEIKEPCIVKSNQFNEFQRIISLSNQMLENARQQRWDDVSAIEGQRRQLLTEFFSQPVKVQKGILANSIRSILENDREIVRLGAEERDELRGALQKFNRQKHAVHAYSAAV